MIRLFYCSTQNVANSDNNSKKRDDGFSQRRHLTSVIVFAVDLINVFPKRESCNVTSVLFQQKEIPNEPNKSTTIVTKQRSRMPAMRLDGLDCY